MAATRALQSLSAPAHGGALTVIDSTGSVRTFGAGDPGVTLHLHGGSLLDLLTGDPLMAFGEAYMDGQVDVEGDLGDLVSFAIRNGLSAPGQEPQRLAGAVRRVTAAARPFRSRAKEIAHHYDIGNDFFQLWLDESLTYSCAYFRSPSDTLEQAQRQKIDHSLRKLRLQPRERLLDIGCGWGALLLRAAECFGVQAHGITLSAEQHAAVNAAVQSRGLQGQVSAELCSYDQLAGRAAAADKGAHPGPFDKIVSIGMAEHVGKEHLAGFARAMETLLQPGGLALLHLITGVKHCPANAWTKKYIFPGSYLPTLAEVIDHLSEAGLHVWDVENLAPHYKMTLDCWSQRFERAVPLIREKFDERFVRMWRLYLRASAASFAEGVIEVHQILVSRGRPRHLGLTRDDLRAAPVLLR